jgi:hypothetical protein
MENLSLFAFIFYLELINICIYFIEILSVLVFVLLIVICICFIEILSLFVFVLSRAYRCLYMLYRELIVCIYCLLVMSVKLITVLE